MIEIQVEGMTCGSCVARVKRAVQSVDGAAEVNVEMKTQTVRVTTTANIDAVKSAVTDAGYPVKAGTEA